nr:nucleotidyl transferase AbiEii/AbiGii toxin family protein [Rubrobacter sp.]
MISRGDANTRERDYADVLALSKVHSVEARKLRQALEKTAVHRGTELVPLSEALDTLPAARQPDWRAFLARTGLPNMPQSFEEAVEEVRVFVDPVLRNDSDLFHWNTAAREWERPE